MLCAAKHFSINHVEMQATSEPSVDIQNTLWHQRRQDKILRPVFESATSAELTEAVEVDQESTKAITEEVDEKEPGTEGTKNEDNLVYVFIKWSLVWTTG